MVAAGRLHIVRYDHIGQYGGAGPEKIVMGREDIPQGEQTEKAAWRVGDCCIARWSQDNAWYNAEVLRVGVGESYVVKFVDYGDEDNVIEQDMVKTSVEIPAESFVD